MMPAHSAIARFNRDLTLGRLLNVGLIAAVVLCLLFGSMIESGAAKVLLVVLLGALWTALSYHSMRGSRLAAGSPSLIAAGEFDQAEDQIEQALRSFSIFRRAKLMSLHHLAVLRHAQRRWGDAAELCRALLRQRLGPGDGLARQSRLIFADSLLELGDLRAAHEALLGLYQQRLSLAEAMTLLRVQLDYLWRIGSWDSMLAGVATKVGLAELMNTDNAAGVQALLALAARKLGRSEWADYLRRRVELLVDVDQLIKQRPILHELYRVDDSTPAAQNAAPGRAESTP